MENREKTIKNYVEGYNQFDIEKMTTDLDETIVFENIQNGETNMSLNGLTAFKQQAEQAKAYFSERTQTIKTFNHSESSTEIEIDYKAVLNMDFPNGLKKGQTIHLEGKSIFTFSNEKIIKIVDIS